LTHVNIGVGGIGDCGWLEEEVTAMDDATLRDDVLAELDFEPSIDAAHIGVAVDGGVVTLSGHVSTYAEKLAAETAARRVRGVRAIAQEIQVRYPTDKRTGDDEIAKRAVNIIDWDTSIPRDSVNVTVQKGWVTLSGQATWQYQRKAAEDAVKRLSGVMGVVNNMTLKQPVDIANIRRQIEKALARRAEVEANAIRVKVQDGKVTLEGKVDNWDERQAVADAAWSVAGVQAVSDFLEIRQ
jgi:osmotically-inducible protein OsmY